MPDGISQVIQTLDEKISKHRAVQSNLNDEMNNYVKDLVAHGNWPFETVTPDEYLSRALPFLEAVYNAYSGKIDGKEATPAQLYDDVAHETGRWISCLQKLRIEAHIKHLQEEILISMDQVLPETRHDAYAKETVLDRLADMGYNINQRVLEYMQPFLEEQGITPIIARKENMRDYIADQEIARADVAAREYIDAFAKVYDNKEGIIKDGLPSETTIGKFVDLVARNKDKKEFHEELVTALLAKKLDIDYIQQYVLPNLELKAIEYQALAAIEDHAISVAGILGDSDFWTDYQKQVDALDTIEAALKAAKTRQKEIDPNNEVNLQQKEDGTYTLTVKEERGVRTKEEREEEGKKTTTTVEKNMHIKQRDIDLGRIATYADTQRKVYRAYGETKTIEEPTKNPKKNNERKVTTKKRVFGEFAAVRKASFKYSGKREARQDFTANVRRLENTVVKRSDFGYTTLETKLVSNKIDMFNAKLALSAPTRDYIGTHTASLKMSGAETRTDFRDGAVVVEATVAEGKIGFGKQISKEDLSLGIAKAVLKEVSKGENMNLLGVINEVGDMYNGIIQTVPTTKLLGLKVSVADIDVAKAELKSITTDAPTQESGDATEAPKMGSISSPIVNAVMEDVKRIPEEIKLVNDCLMQTAPTPVELFPFDRSDFIGRATLAGETINATDKTHHISPHEELYERGQSL